LRADDSVPPEEGSTTDAPDRHGQRKLAHSIVLAMLA